MHNQPLTREKTERCDKLEPKLAPLLSLKIYFEKATDSVIRSRTCILPPDFSYQVALFSP